MAYDMNSFNRRLRMMENAETGKMAAFVADLKDDKEFEEYHNVLVRTCMYLKSNVLLEKLLNLPEIDQSSSYYKKAVAGVYTYAAANHANSNKKMLELLLGKFNDDPQIKRRTLSFIFCAVAVTPQDCASTIAAGMLIKNGADVETAMTDYKGHPIYQESIRNDWTNEWHAEQRVRVFKNKALNI